MTNDHFEHAGICSVYLLPVRRSPTFNCGVEYVPKFEDITQELSIKDGIQPGSWYVTSITQNVLDKVQIPQQERRIRVTRATFHSIFESTPIR